jgi:hypothetical protein
MAPAPSPVSPSSVGTPPARSEVAPAPSTSFAPAGGASPPVASPYATASRPSPSATAAQPAAALPKRTSLGLSGFLSLIGGGLVLLSTAVAWVDVGLGENAFNTPAEYIWDDAKFREALILPELEVGLPLAVVIGVCGAIALLAALVQRARQLAIVGGLGALAAAGLFLYQARSVADGSDFGFTDVAGPGPFLAVFGGVLAIAGGIVARRQQK